jgi:hypothetical protein
MAKKSPFGKLSSKLQAQGKSKEQAKAIAGSIARKKGKAPGGKNFKPSTAAGRKRYGK